MSKNEIVSKNEMLFYEEFVAANQMLRGQMSPVGALTGRMFAALVAQIDATDKTFQREYKILVNDFPELLNGESFSRIEHAAKELAGMKLILKNAQTERLVVFNFFRKITYEKGVLSARFIDDEIGGFLLNLKDCFTKFNLWEFFNLNGEYAQRLFQIMKSYESLEKATMKLTDLHFALGISKDSVAATNFAEFKRKILNPALKQINKNTSLDVSFDAKGRGEFRRLQFYFGDAQPAKRIDRHFYAMQEKRLKEIERERKVIKCRHKHFDKSLVLTCNRDNTPAVCRVCDEYGEKIKSHLKDGLFPEK
ncbi:hypothetical protein AGMMS49959_18370 [Planctomycetales bacterium]|nr:hypothetical protein AGMMS49959_18370 [Planctomycetales bacterium]